MVIDSGFTRADALRVAANVLDTGKTLDLFEGTDFELTRFEPDEHASRLHRREECPRVPATADQWIEIDLGRERPIHRVTLDLGVEDVHYPDKEPAAARGSPG